MGKPVSAPSQKCSIMIIVCIVPIYLLKSSQKYCIVENVTFPYVPQEKMHKKGKLFHKANLLILYSSIMYVM